MPGFFEAAKNFRQTESKHTVTIQGQTVEVSQEEKIEIVRNGENNYVLQDGRPCLIVVKREKYRHAEIEKFTSDPFWPTEEFVWKK
jgi:hypothetical protein